MLLTVPARCATLTVMSTTEGNSIPGNFRVLPRTLLNNRPVYFHAQRNLYLYFYVDDTCAFWVIGPTMGEKAGIMYAYDVTADPSMLAATWTVFDNGVWVVDHNLQLECDV